MFTGIVKTTTKIREAVRKNGSLILKIEKPKKWKLVPGDSVATDGVCLTVKKVGSQFYFTELMPATLAKTTFGVQLPQKVNLEPPLSLSDLLGGHMVMGHVDTVGKIEKIKSLGDSKIFQISFPKEYRGLVAPKAAVAVAGVSLTVVEAGKNWFTVSLVDYTLKHTTLGEKTKGHLVNLEFDIIAKYLERILRYEKK